MIEIAVTKRWKRQRFSSLFTENKNKNQNCTVTHALQFFFGTIIPKKEYELTETLRKIYTKYTIVSPGNIILNGLNLNYDFVSQRIGLVKERGIITSAYIVLQPREGVNYEYYCYLFKAMDAHKFFHGMGSGIRLTLSYDDLKNVLLPVPPREEQDQIVRFLDWKVSGINRLINIRKRQIAELEEIKRSKIGLLIMGQQQNVPYKETAVSWVKTIPAHWAEKSLVQIAEEQQIKNAGMIEDNLLSLSYGKIINKDINSTDGLLPASFEGYQIVHDGNIILRLTDLQNDHRSLRTGLVTQTGIITSAYTCLKVRGNILPEYLQLQLHVADLCKVFYGMGGGVRQSIGFKEIRKLIVAVPLIEEQQHILECVRGVEKPVNHAIQKNRDIIAGLEDLKTRLISDVVTGKIDVRDVKIPEYEFIEEDAEEAIDDGGENDTEQED